MTVEAAVTKLMFLLGQGLGAAGLMRAMGGPLCGEMTIR
jgi:hypothetical protein